MSANFSRNVNIQALSAKTFVNTVINPDIELPYDEDINTNDYGNKYCGGLYIANDGDLIVVMAGDSDNEITFPKVKGGTILNIQVKKVLSTSDCVPVIGLF